MTANFSVAQAVEKYRNEKLREMLIYFVFLIFFTVSTIHKRMVPERGMLLSSIKHAYLENRFVTTEGSVPTPFIPSRTNSSTTQTAQNAHEYEHKRAQKLSPTHTQKDSSQILRRFRDPKP